jgi:ABC-type cobalamin/Fe3+-siderophores transport system ATPase subunit
MDPVRLTFPSDAVVVVAGLPGAGKTTLIRRAVDRAEVRVVDTDDQRAGRRTGRFLYAGHYARVLAAIAGPAPAVIHSRGTHGWLRRAIVLLATLRGRPAHLILLDADRAEAEAGQRARGRIIGRAEMARQAARWRRVMARRGRGEGWASVVVLDREQAARTSALAFQAPTWAMAASVVSNMSRHAGSPAISNTSRG